MHHISIFQFVQLLHLKQLLNIIPIRRRNTITNIQFPSPESYSADMAILKRLPGVEVTITVDNEPLQEYEPKKETDPYDSVTRYVQTQPDQNFEIKIVTNQGSTRGAGLKYEITIDANIADANVVTSE